MTLHNALSETDISSKFKRFVDSRWLSIGPVIDRVVEQYDVLHHFFVKGKFDAKTRETYVLNEFWFIYKIRNPLYCTYCLRAI